MANLFKRRGESIGVQQLKADVALVTAPKSKRVKTQHVANNEDHHMLYDTRMTKQEQLLYEFQKAAEEAQMSEYTEASGRRSRADPMGGLLIGYNKWRNKS